MNQGGQVTIRVLGTSSDGDLEPLTVVLSAIAWDDWFKYSTLYEAEFVDKHSERHSIGRVKIAIDGMARDQKHPLPRGSSYNEPIDGIYSVGQSEEYYSNLGALDEDARFAFALALGDLVAYPARRDRYGDPDVLSDSLLRFVSTSSLNGEFRRLFDGAEHLNSFDVRYDHGDLSLQFQVKPNSLPRTHLHAIVGRNGVGKSHLLRQISRTLLFETRDEDGPSLRAFDEDGNDEGVFAGLVMITFSAFETFMPPRTWFNRPGMTFTYFGLREWIKDSAASDKWLIRYRTPNALWKSFISSAEVVKSHDRVNLWVRSLEMLRGDPVFDQLDFDSLQFGTEDNQKAIFNDLSDGHKSVVLAITMIAASVEERTLVVMDEPEAHLHPPLLSAFTRALSRLLRERNAFAIVATHSPVILQEVPRNCVSLLDRDLDDVTSRRLAIETYGEDVATLTHEVFHLEVDKSNYSRDLKLLADEGLKYHEALDRLDGSLGLEGRSILRALCRKNEE